MKDLAEFKYDTTISIQAGAEYVGIFMADSMVSFEMTFLTQIASIFDVDYENLIYEGITYGSIDE